MKQNPAGRENLPRVFSFFISARCGVGPSQSGAIRQAPLHPPDRLLLRRWCRSRIADASPRIADAGRATERWKSSL